MHFYLFFPICTALGRGLPTAHSTLESNRSTYTRSDIKIYVQLLQTRGKKEYVSRVATTLEEAQTLIESRFEYVTDMQFGEVTYKLFRKRKPWKPS